MKMSSKKGISPVVAKLLGVLIYIGFLVAFVVLFVSGYFDIHEIVQESITESHTINLAQVLMAYPKIIYTDNEFVHRGIFDKSKIENQFTDDSDMTIEIGYPNSIIFIGILDYKNRLRTSVKYMGPVKAGNPASDYIICLWDETVSEIPNDDIFLKYDLWDNLQITGCEQTEASNFGATTRVFPILIRDDEDGGQIYPATLYVTLKEAWDIGAILGV